MKIVTEYVHPPIPDRSSDWSAVDSDAYDVDCDEDGYFSRCPIGRGRTEQEAVDDLLAQLFEQADGDLEYDQVESQAPTGVHPMRFRWSEGWQQWVPDDEEIEQEPEPETVSYFDWNAPAPEVPHRCNALDCIPCWNAGVRYADWLKTRKLEQLL